MIDATARPWTTRLRLPALVLLVCGLLAIPAPGPTAHAALGAAPQAAQAVPTYYQAVRTPGYSVYCRWDVHLLLGNSNGEGCFDSSGDYFAVEDTRANGRSVAVLWWKVGGGLRGICRNALGAGKRSAWPTCRAESTIPEGIRIRARLAECNQTAARTCRKFSHYVNLGPIRTYRTTHPAD